MNIGCHSPGEKVKTDNKTYFIDISGNIWFCDMYGVREKISWKIGEKKVERG